MKRDVLLFWKILVAVLTVLCVGLLVAVIVVSVKYVDLKESSRNTGAPDTCDTDGLSSSGDEPLKSQGLFTDLTTKELIAVRDYMLKQRSLELKPFYNATVDSNYIYMIQVKLPSKEEVLDFLDGGNRKPERSALVVIFQGASVVVREYIVSGQLNNIEKMSHVQRGRDINFNTRPYDRVQNTAVEKIVRNETNKARHVLNESYSGYCYWCTGKRLKFIIQAPFGGGKERVRNERTTWIKFVRDLEGNTLHPVGFEFLLDFSGADVSQWKVKQVYYNGQAFGSIDQLVQKYNERLLIDRIVIPAPPEDKTLFSSYDRRGEQFPKKPLRAPKFYEPDGRRYTVSGRHVEYMSWGFDFRLDSISGLQLLDIKFDGTRIAYELSVQEGIAFYSGYSPFLATARYVYSAWALGQKSFELVRGVDCPDTAVFFDSAHHVDTAGPQSVKNAVCLFEFDTAVPLRRHYDNDHVGGYKFYGGLGSHALVLRSISTIFDADIIFDFVFYQNGAIESKVRTTGYLQTAYSTAKEQPSFGYQIHKNIIGTTQENLFHFKVDLDVGGTRNSFESIKIENEKVSDLQWLIDGSQNIVRSHQKLNEREAAFEFYSNQHSLFNMYHEYKLNEYGSKRGYLIRPTETGTLTTPDWYRANMASWSSYKVCITRQKSSEEKSSSIYNQVNPTQVKFRNFFEDNENIDGEDLVAWVSIGTMHLSRAEDVPSVTTTGNTASFFLEPFNYFDFDPSIRSTNAVVIKPEDHKFSDIKVERYGTPTGPACVPRSLSFHFNGTY